MIRYFEVVDPYYALVKAKNQHDAKKIYNEAVADLEDLDEIREVPENYALARFSQVPGENGELIDPVDVLKDFDDAENKVLITDGSLL